MKRILYLSSGTGSGTIAKGRALRRAVQRRGLNLEVGIAAATDYAITLESTGEFTRTWSTRTNYEMLAQHFDKAISDFKPDAVITCYLPDLNKRLAEQHSNIPFYMLWRKHMNLDAFRPHLKDSLFQLAFTFEPTAENDLIFSEVPSYRVFRTPPIYSIWCDELYPREQARQALLAAWGHRSNDLRPLMLVPHNGSSTDEADQLIAATMRNADRRYLILPFSQNKAANGRFIQEPIARYFNAVDYLVGAAGPTLFWEWQRYKPAKAQEHFYVAPRQFDPQEWRKLLTVTPNMLGNGENGADTVLRQLVGSDLIPEEAVEIPPSATAVAPEPFRTKR